MGAAWYPVLSGPTLADVAVVGEQVPSPARVEGVEIAFLPTRYA